MAKRLIDCTVSEMSGFTKADKISSIAGCEGRVMACECIGFVTPMLGTITNAEFVSSLGADIVLLNIFDVDKPVILGLPEVAPEDTIREIKRLTGRIIGINLEPVPENFASENNTNLWKISEGRKATVANAIKARDMGVDLILLTGNPGNGVNNDAICATLKEFKKAIGDDVILAAGKMHASEVLSEGGENIITKNDVRRFAEAGADVILYPAPGTVPGITMEYIRELVQETHKLGCLAMSSIGTSQEGADVETIRRIALMCKMAGIDIHHIGDSGFTGTAVPEDITAYSVTIRGVRHTYRRMAMSIAR